MTASQTWLISVGYGAATGASGSATDSMTCTSKVIAGVDPAIWLLAVERLIDKNAVLLHARPLADETVALLLLKPETLDDAVQKLDHVPRSDGWRRLAALRDTLRRQAAEG